MHQRRYATKLSFQTSLLGELIPSSSYNQILLFIAANVTLFIAI